MRVSQIGGYHVIATLLFSGGQRVLGHRWRNRHVFDGECLVRFFLIQELDEQFAPYRVGIAAACLLHACNAKLNGRALRRTRNRGNTYTNQSDKECEALHVDLSKTEV